MYGNWEGKFVFLLGLKGFKENLNYKLFLVDNK